jgi:cell division transport system ATP-binding protein
MILFSNVTKVYENSGTLALREVNFFVEKGEFVFVIGSSGAGKSTITKLIMREELPTEGNILINNTDITTIPRAELPYYRRKMGMVFQDFRLLPAKSVFDNVAFALQVIGASKREIRRKVPAVLNLVGLAQKAKDKVTELSGGEQQRVALARAIINNPPVLLCDEPTGNLDPQTAIEIMEILNQINQNGTTILVVTHASDIVNLMQKRVIELQDGVIIRDQKRGVYTA